MDEYKDDIKRRKKRGHMSEDEDDDDDDYNNEGSTTDDEDDEDDDDDDYINGKPSTSDSLAYAFIHDARKKKLMHLKKYITGKKMGGRRGVN